MHKMQQLVLLNESIRVTFTVGDDMKRKRKGRYRQTGVPKTKNEYEMIDGNWTKHPVAFCSYYGGALTRNMMHTHRCCEKECKRLDKNYKFE